MFNAAGGSIIVGLAEKNRYLRARSLAGYPTIESADQELLIVGADLRDGESWEQYASRLQEAIDEVIRPRLHAWLRIEKAVVGDRVLAVVHVVPGPTRLWAYVVSGERDSYFYVRREGRTDLLRDLEADIYRSHARTDLEPAD
jgi:predicted HTH transcriptional regulator